MLNISTLTPTELKTLLELERLQRMAGIIFTKMPTVLLLKFSNSGFGFGFDEIGY